MTGTAAYLRFQLRCQEILLAEVEIRIHQELADVRLQCRFGADSLALDYPLKNGFERGRRRMVGERHGESSKSNKVYRTTKGPLSPSAIVVQAACACWP
uniref:Uncharacterized protein n=1 Tax=Streptomyces auratus AGR0001 TaxID=1160718 RepID=J2K2H8_9ACTN